MSTPKDERDFLRALHDLANRADAVGRIGTARVFDHCARVVAELRADRTNARIDADRLQNRIAASVGLVRNQEKTINRLRQERDAYKAEFENARHVGDASLRRVCTNFEITETNRLRLTQRCKELEESAVQSAKRIERCLRTMHKQDIENDKLQKDRDETFKRLTSAYATCERLRYALEEGAAEQQDKWDNAMIDTLNRRLAEANKCAVLYAKQLRDIHDTFDCGED